MPNINIDENPSNADWLHANWNLPPYRTPAFFRYLEKRGITLTEFKKGPKYKAAEKKGMIVKDKWKGQKKK